MPQDVAVTEVLANLNIGYIVGAAFVLTALRFALLPMKNDFAKWLAELLESMVIAGVLVFMVIRPFLVQAFFIPSPSMEPTLLGHKHGYDAGIGVNYPEDASDHIFVNKLAVRFADPKRGDIIVFRAPKRADMTGAGVENVLIKRLIAVGGDEVHVKPDEKGVIHVYVNGKPIEEPYLASSEPMQNITGAERENFGVDKPLKLAPDELFVMGDNRNHSNDGRFWGPLKRDRVIGNALFIFWPLNRIRIIR